MALIDKASLLMVPSTYEAGTLYNVLPSGNRAPDSTDQNSGYDQTRADFTFDRGSNAAATRVNSDGLIEKYRENLLLQSNQFDTTWQEVNAGAQSSSIEDIDGGTNAWLLRETAVTGAHYIRQSSGITSGVGTFSFYAKKKDYDWVQFSQSGDGGNYANFNIANGTLGNANSSFFIDRKIEAVGATGWYRCSVTYTFGSGAYVGISLIRSDVSTRYDSYSGDVTKGTYIQNAQLETGLVSTDYLDSGATTAKAGVLIDLPRINYDANGENGALLLEPSRQQLFQYSEYATGWSTSNTGITIEENATTSPEGVNNAAKIKEDGTNAAHAVRQLTGPTLTSGTDYTFSFFAKKGERSIVALSNTIGASNDANCFFDLENGQVLTNQFNSASIEDFGNGWFRCIVTDTADAADDYDTRIYTATADNQFSHQGVSGSGLYIYGLQLEAGSYVSSYIPNHGTSSGVTRAADSCSVTGVSDVIGQTEGTIYAEFEIDNLSESGNEKVLFYMKDTGTGERYLSFVNNGSLTYIESNGAVIANISKTGLSVGSYKAAIAYKTNDFAFYLNGEQVGTDNAGTPSGFSTFGFQYYNAAVAGTQFAKQTAIFKERLSNAELAALTA